MAIEWLNYVFTDSTSEGAARLVALALAHHANKDHRGACWPGIATLAGDTRLSERGVQKGIRKLMALGELRIVLAGGRRRGDKAGWPNVYLLVAGRREAELAEATAWVNHVHPWQGRTKAPARVNDVPPTVNHVRGNRNGTGSEPTPPPNPPLERGGNRASHQGDREDRAARRAAKAEARRIADEADAKRVLKGTRYDRESHLYEPHPNDRPRTAEELAAAAASAAAATAAATNSAAAVPTAQTPRLAAVPPAAQSTISAQAAPTPASSKPAQPEPPGPGLAATAKAILAAMDAARANRLRPAGGPGDDPKAAEFERQRKQAKAELVALRAAQEGWAERQEATA